MSALHRPIQHCGLDSIAFPDNSPAFPDGSTRHIVFVET